MFTFFFLFFPEKLANTLCIQSKLLKGKCLELRLIEGGRDLLGAAAPNSWIKLSCDTEMSANFKVLIPSFQEFCLS